VQQITVAASLFIDYAAQLQELGIEPAALFRRAGVDVAILGRATDRLSGDEAQRLWDAAMALTGDPLVALHSAERYRPSALNILGYVVLNCATGLDVLDRLTRYSTLLNDAMHVRTTREPARVTVHFALAPTPSGSRGPDPRHPVEATSAGLVLTLRALTGRPMVPTEVMFRHPAAGPVEEYHRIFGTLVRFGGEENRVTLRLEELNAPIPAADHTLLSLFDGHAASRLGELQRDGATSRRVLRAVASRLRGTAPDITTIATDLAMSVRALQRALREEGTTYQALLDAARREIAERQLRAPGVSAADVALLLGYSEASAFTRAFRRWTGMTPSAWASAGAPHA
jgi:AraC-like DNA-binding protein